MIDKPRIESAVREILAAIGEDPDREGLLETPQRVARMYEEVFAGLHKDPHEEFRIFHEPGNDEMVLVRDIPLYSMCEHHLLPFMGKAHVAYLPSRKVAGVSKLARVVEGFARRPQVQERRRRVPRHAPERRVRGIRREHDGHVYRGGAGDPEEGHRDAAVDPREALGAVHDEVERAAARPSARAQATQGGAQLRDAHQLVVCTRRRRCGVALSSPSPSPASGSGSCSCGGSSRHARHLPENCAVQVPRARELGREHRDVVDARVIERLRHKFSALA